MLDLSSILKSFALFVVLFGVLLGLASTDRIEKRLGQWFIDSSTTWFEWTMPQAAINVEHDRDPNKFDPSEVWISPVDNVWFQEQLREVQRTGQSLAIDNKASLLFKIGTFPMTSLVFLIALVLATPMPIKKRLKKLLIALLIFAAYFYFFIYFEIMYHMAVSRIGVYELDGIALSIVVFIKKTFCNFGFSLTFAIIVWAVTCVDFNALFNQFNLALQGKSPELNKVSVSKRPKTFSKKKKKK